MPDEQTTYHLGNVLRKTRIARGLSLEEAAQSLQITNSALESIEKGQSNVPANLMIKIARLYETSLDKILPKPKTCPACDGQGTI
jgi:transcriptional regulator with XRE-family HTH domain